MRSLQGKLEHERRRVSESTDVGHLSRHLQQRAAVPGAVSGGGSGGTDLAAATEHAASLRTELESCRKRLRNERAAWDQDRESLVGDVDRWRHKAEEYVGVLSR